jgi:hypothetical protein
VAKNTTNPRKAPQVVFAVLYVLSVYGLTNLWEDGPPGTIVAAVVIPCLFWSAAYVALTEMLDEWDENQRLKHLTPEHREQLAEAQRVISLAKERRQERFESREERFESRGHELVFKIIAKRSRQRFHQYSYYKGIDGWYLHRKMVKKAEAEEREFKGAHGFGYATIDEVRLEMTKQKVELEEGTILMLLLSDLSRLGLVTKTEEPRFLAFSTECHHLTEKGTRHYSGW